MVLNASVGSTGLLVSSGIGVLMVTSKSMVIGYLVKGFETVELASKGGDHLVVSNSPAVCAGEMAALVIYVVLFLEVIVA